MGHYKLPQGWVECQLGDVFEIITGKTPPKKNPEYFNGDIPFVKPGDLDKEIYITQTEDDSLTVEGLKYAPNLPKNTVLVSCIGNLGKKAILGVVGSCNQQINAIIPNGYIENKYTYFYIDKIVPWLEANASATTVKILNKGKFEQAPFLLPPQNEQRRIVEKIESEFAKIDEGLEHLENAKEQIKQYRQSVLKSAFEGKLYKTSEWEIFNILELCSIINGTTIDKSLEKQFGEIPYIKVSDMNLPENSVKITTSSRFVNKNEIKANTIIPKNSIIFPKRGGAIATNKKRKVIFPIIIDLNIMALIPNNTNILSHEYLYYWLQKLDLSTISNGGAVPQINRYSFENLFLKLPTLEEQKRIVEEIEKRFAVADEVEKVVEENIEKAKQLKQSILKKAFEGRLVPQDPTDEPASILLEKIKQERSKK